MRPTKSTTSSGPTRVNISCKRRSIILWLLLCSISLVVVVLNSPLLFQLGWQKVSALLVLNGLQIGACQAEGRAPLCGKYKKKRTANTQKFR